MKIQPNSIRSAINEFQQEAKSAEGPKISNEVPPESKNVQAAQEFASSIKSEQSFTAMMRTNELQKTFEQTKTAPQILPGDVTELQSQLEKVDVEIKEIMTEMETIKNKEKEEQEEIKNRQEQEENILQNLDKAADSYTAILDSTKLL